MSAKVVCDGDGLRCLKERPADDGWITVSGLDMGDLHFCTVKCLTGYAQQLAVIQEHYEAQFHDAHIEPPC